MIPIPQKIYRWFVKRLPMGQRIALYPPLRAMGVKALEVTPELKQARFLLPLNRRSRNSGGTMFGGNQASLADPIAALACLAHFPGHDVFTRKLELDFRAPGNSDLELRFEFPAETEQQIRQALDSNGKADARFRYAYYTSSGIECTRVFCEVAIRPHNYHARKNKK